MVDIIFLIVTFGFLFGLSFLPATVYIVSAGGEYRLRRRETMASNAKDIQLQELKATVSQLKTMVSEQTEVIISLRLMINEKSNHEKALQEQVDYLTKTFRLFQRKKI